MFYFVFDFYKLVDVASEVLVGEALRLFDRIRKNLAQLSIGSKLTFVPKIKNARDFIVLSLAINICVRTSKRMKKC